MLGEFPAKGVSHLSTEAIGYRNIAPSRLHIQRVASIQCRVKNIRRVGALTQGESDGVLLIRLSSAVVSLIKLERNV